MEYISPAPAVSYVAPAPAVVKYIAPASAVSYVLPAPAVVKYIAPAPAVSYVAPAPLLAAQAPAVAYAAPAPAVTYASAVSTLSRFHDSVGGFSPAPVVEVSTAFIGDIRFLTRHQLHLMHPSSTATKHFQGALSQQGMSEGSGPHPHERVGAALRADLKLESQSCGVHVPEGRHHLEELSNQCARFQKIHAHHLSPVVMRSCIVSEN